MKKVVPGQPINFPARDWNNIADRTNPGAIGSQPGQGASLSTEVVYVKNSLGRDLARYSAVCIGAPADLPTGQNDPVFPLLNPSLQNLYGKTRVAFTVAILQEPIADGRTGRAQISGFTPARFKENENGALSPVLYGAMSDRDDMLVAADAGPISVLSTATQLNGANRLLWVRLGEPVSVSSGYVNYTVGTVNASPSYLYSYGTDLTYASFGDLRRLGLYSSTSTGTPATPAGNLYIARNGRFLVNVLWVVLPKSTMPLPSAGDRFEYIVNWGGVIAEFGSISYSAWTGASEMSTGRNWQLSGQRTYPISQNLNFDSSGAAQLWIPGVTVKRLNSSGTVMDTVELQGGGQITVTYMGPPTAGIAPWTLADKNAVWGRAANGAPIA